MNHISIFSTISERASQNGTNRLFVHGFILAASIILTLLIGLLRFLTGPEYAFSLLFFIPIVLACWFIGKKSGYFIALASILTWLTVDLGMMESFSSGKVPLINESFRLVVFLSGVHLLSTLKSSLKVESEQALSDSLTGIYNRRGFNKYATMEIERSRRTEVPFSVLFLDLDNFKQTNDLYSHQGRDQLLCMVAETVKKRIRSIDIFARLGGDEFVLLLSGTGTNMAYVATRKIHEVLTETIKQMRWPVTFSIGVVICNSAPENTKKLVRMADTAMYMAKKKGKNKVQYSVFPN